MFCLGVDLGGTNIAVGMVNERGEIIKKESVPTLRSRGYEEILSDLANLCKKVISDCGLTEKDINSVGVGTPGTPNPETGVIVFANNLNFRNVPMRDEINKHINIPVYIENDASCAALGEFICGSAQGYSDTIAITLGTGVGGGIIIKGKLFSGHSFCGGEIGHHVVVVDGEKCSCGRSGCWESYVSATALIRDTRIAAARDSKSFLYKMIDGDLSKVDAKTVFDAAKAGDAESQVIVDRYIKMLAEGIANLYNIFEPQMLVIGGGVSYEGEALLKPLKAAVKGKIYGRNAESDMDIRIATLGNDAGIIGAAMLYRQHQD